MLLRPSSRNVGSPTGREPYGDGVSIVVAGVTTCHGTWESHAQGEGRQVSSILSKGGARDAQRRNNSGDHP